MCSNANVKLINIGETLKASIYSHSKYMTIMFPHTNYKLITFCSSEYCLTAKRTNQKFSSSDVNRQFNICELNEPNGMFEE